MFLALFSNIFLAYFLIPFSFGLLYKVALFLGMKWLVLSAKILAIFTAVFVNYFIGRVIRKFLPSSLIKKIENKKLQSYFAIFTFIPVISGIIAFYSGLLKTNFLYFFTISFIFITIYSLLTVYYI